MEKRQLVRTFGSALAAATLSFGLFAAPAIAETTVTSKDNVTMEIDGKVWNGNVDFKQLSDEDNERVVVWVPVTVDDANSITKATLTFSNKGRQGAQEIEVDAEGTWVEGQATGPVVFYDGVNGTPVENIKADFGKQIWLKFVLPIDEDTVINEDGTARILNGTWNAKDVTLTIDGDDYVAAVKGAKFTVKNALDQVVAPDFQSNSLAIAHTELTSKDNNELSVYFDYEGAYRFVVVEANYDDPADRTLALDDADIATVTNSNVQGESFKATFTGLPTKLQGDYTLTELSAKVQQFEEWDGFRIYNVDYYTSLSGGDYTVTAGLVIPLFRAYNPYDGQHLYTENAAEVKDAVAAGWIDEGLAWYAPANIWSSAVKEPVYRLYNQYNGDHHFTTDAVERDTMISNGWSDEGIAFWSLVKDSYMAVGNQFATSQAVWRLFNKWQTVGTHHYTTSVNEYDDLVDLGWTGEGIGWYGVDIKGLDE